MLHGYNIKTFSGIIDETYDKYDGIDRIKCIKEEVKRLLGYSDSEWKKFLLECNEVSVYNVNIIRTTNYEQKIIKELC